MKRRLKVMFSALVVATVVVVLGGAAPAMAAGPPWYYYAGAGQTITTTKLAANLTVHNSYAWTTDHSVTELAVIRGTGTSFQAVEVGYIINRDLNGNPDTHLFSYAWKNGVGLGYGTGGFVRYCPNGSNPCNLPQENDVLIAGPGGTALSSRPFVIEYATNYGVLAWWVSYNGNYFGYWPATLWSSGTTNGGALVSGSRIDIFGEVYSWDDHPCTDMAEGVQPTSSSGGFAGSATINGTTTGVNLTVHTNNSDGVNNSAYYNAVMAVSGGTTSTRSFWYGGDGDC